MCVCVYKLVGFSEDCMARRDWTERIYLSLVVCIHYKVSVPQVMGSTVFSADQLLLSEMNSKFRSWNASTVTSSTSLYI